MQAGRQLFREMVRRRRSQSPTRRSRGEVEESNHIIFQK
jgi:hypothetical protein